MSDTEEGINERYENQTKKERRACYYSDRLDGKRVIACFIDQANSSGRPGYFAN